MAIYNGTQKIDMSGVDKVYVGTQLVYQQVVPKVLTFITLSKLSDTLNRGASFSYSGTVTAHYSDSSLANVTSSTTFSGYNMSVAGTYTVTASYTEDGITKTATYTLTVNKAWSTLFSGSKSAYVRWYSNNISTDGTDSNWLQTIVGTGVNPQLRFTFTLSMNPAPSSINLYKKYYYNNGSLTTTAISSPITMTLTSTTSAINCIGGAYYLQSSARGMGIRVQKNASSSGDTNITLAIAGGNIGEGPGGSNNWRITLTITKVEQYY